MPRALKQEPARAMPALYTEMKVEQRDRLWISQAVEFTATIYGHRNSRVERFPTAVQAAARALEFEREATNGRQAIVYAITASGFATQVVRPAWLDLIKRACALLGDGGSPADAIMLQIDDALLPRNKSEI